MHEQPSISHYTGLLHRHGADSAEARDYRNHHSDNTRFQGQCNIMDQMFRISEETSKKEAQGV